MKGATLTELIDQYTAIEEQRKNLQKAADNKKAEAERFYNEIILQMTNSGRTVWEGSHAVVTMQQLVEPKAEDWHKIWIHVRATGEFDLLHKRITASAVKDRWDAGVEVPGIERWPVTKLHFTTKV